MNRLIDRNLMRAALAAITFLALGASLSACNTTEGFGKDVKGTGQAIENTADKNK